MTMLAVAAGVAIAAGGAALSASAAGKKRKGATAIANTPGLDISATQAETIAANQSNFDAASNLASSVDVGNQQRLLAMLRAANPKFDEIQAGANKGILDLFDDSTTLRYAQDSAAARALEGGYSGSPRQGRAMEQYFDIRKTQKTQLGVSLATQWLNQFRAPQMDVTSMLVSPQTALGMRSNEREMRLKMLTGANNMTSGNQIWGNFMTQTGGMIAGAGVQSWLTGGTPKVETPPPGGAVTPSHGFNSLNQPNTAPSSYYNPMNPYGP